jgi:S-adenosylmethionine:diacylglycerol 3-amino-3-carboxypropyl transferase
MPVPARERSLTCDAASSDNFVLHVVHLRRYPGAEESGPWALVLEFSTIDRDNQRVWMRRGGETMEKFSPQDERA